MWCCLPRFDGDPIFCELLNGDAAEKDDSGGVFEIAVENFARSEQEYLTNTAILVTRLYDANGSAVEIRDFARLPGDGPGTCRQPGLYPAPV